MTAHEREISRAVGDSAVAGLAPSPNAPTQELSIEHFRRDMYDAALQGLIDTLDRLYYLRMLVQSSTSYGGDLEHVIALPDLDAPIRAVRTLTERVQQQQDALHGGPLQIVGPPRQE